MLAESPKAMSAGKYCLIDFMLADFLR